MIVCILEARAARSRETDDGELLFAIRAAIFGGFTSIIELLLDSNTKHKFLILPGMAAAANQLEIYQLLCRRLGAPLGDFEYLYQAAAHGHLEFVRFCIANGFSVNSDGIPKDELLHLRLPMQYACLGGAPECREASAGSWR